MTTWLVAAITQHPLMCERHDVMSGVLGSRGTAVSVRVIARWCRVGEGRDGSYQHKAEA